MLPNPLSPLIVGQWLLRLLLSFGGLILLFEWGGSYFIDLMIPLYKVVATWLTPAAYEVVDIVQVGGSRQQYIKLITAQAEPIRYSGQLIPRGAEIESRTLRGYAFQLPIITLGLVLSWPAVALKWRLQLLLLTVPLVVMASLLDIPFVLLGAFTDVIQFAHNPAQAPQHLLISWMRLMEDAGRIALGGALAVAIIAGHQWVLRRVR